MWSSRPSTLVHFIHFMFRSYVRRAWDKCYNIIIFPHLFFFRRSKSSPHPQAVICHSLSAHIRYLLFPNPQLFFIKISFEFISTGLLLVMIPRLEKHRLIVKTIGYFLFLNFLVDDILRSNDWRKLWIILKRFI